MKNECTTVQFQRDGHPCGQLDAYDHHGNGRSNKAWMGSCESTPIDLPNLKAVAAFAKAGGLTFTKLYDAA